MGQGSAQRPSVGADKDDFLGAAVVEVGLGAIASVGSDGPASTAQCHAARSAARRHRHVTFLHQCTLTPDYAPNTPGRGWDGRLVTPRGPTTGRRGLLLNALPGVRRSRALHGRRGREPEP